MNPKIKHAIAVAAAAAILAFAKTACEGPSPEPTGANVVVFLPDVVLSVDATTTSLPDAVTP